MNEVDLTSRAFRSDAYTSDQPEVELGPAEHDGRVVELRDTRQDPGLELVDRVHPYVAQEGPGHLREGALDEVEPGAVLGGMDVLEAARPGGEIGAGLAADVGRVVVERPVRGRSTMPARRSSKKRLRHFDTIWTGVSSRRAISVFSWLSAARSTIRARTTSRYGAEYRRLVDSRTARSTGANPMMNGLCLGMYSSCCEREDHPPSGGLDTPSY